MGGFRQCFTAAAGYTLLRCDYNWLELCTLASVCETTFGFSVLADVIRSGIDPHAYTAALFENVTLEEFMTWKDSEDAELKERFTTHRHRAKAINFGIAGGQGISSLREAALENFGVFLTHVSLLQYSWQGFSITDSFGISSISSAERGKKA
jgi:DNA polymerase I-like protein with 3'-5' exonuclease and polymerase domains